MFKEIMIFITEHAFLLKIPTHKLMNKQSNRTTTIVRSLRMEDSFEGVCIQIECTRL